jgi:hypothetical protein
MSLLDQLSVEDDVYLDSDQVNLLLAADPMFKDRYEKQRDTENAVSLEDLKKTSDAYDRQLPYDGETVRQTDLDPSVSAMLKSKKSK